MCGDTYRSCDVSASENELAKDSQASYQLNMFVYAYLSRLCKAVAVERKRKKR